MDFKNLLFKSTFFTLSLVLIFTSLVPMSTSANTSPDTQNLKTEEAAVILKALDKSSIVQADGTTLINEKQLEQELKDHPQYQVIKKELEKQNLLTNKTLIDSNMAVMAASNVNPAWTATRNACARDYLGSRYGIEAGATALAALFSGSFRKAAAELAKKSASVTVPGLITVYGYMNYKCIREANSKHNLYL